MEVAPQAKTGLAKQFESHAFHLSVIVVLSSLLLFPHLHQGGLSGFDDALYAHEAKQMLLTGDWGTIRNSGAVNFEYPPMFVWLEALSVKLMGISDFAAKFPSALAGLLTIVLVFCIARMWSREFWLPVASGWVLMLTQYFLKYSMHAMTDVPFTFFFTLAIYLYMLGLRRSRFMILCGLTIGLAILTRSILGVLPIVIIAGHWAWARPPLPRRYAVYGLIVALAAPAAWYASEYRLYGDQFLTGHFSFISRKAFSGASRGSWKALRDLLEYPWLLLRLYWPWLPLMLAGLFMQFKKMVQFREKLATLLVMWVFAVIIPFSLADAKVLRYIMPVFPAFAVLSAIPASRWIERHIAVSRSSRKPFTVYCALCAIVLVIAAISTPQSRAEEMIALAPVVDRNTPPGERVFMFTHGEARYDYVNQLLWYSNRFFDHVRDASQLNVWLRSGEGRTFVIDKDSYGQLVERSGVKVAVLGQSGSFICFRTL
jgi:4-amino-4-deoxy-L-arabinose transferase-like glycosyltransferase